MIKGAEKEVKVVGSPKQWGIEITKKGTFNFEKLYKLFMAWFSDYEYVAEESGYATKPLLPQGEEIKVDVSGFRDVSKYIRFWIEVEIWGIRLKKVGNSYKGDLKIRFKGWIEKDPKGRWRHFEFFRQIYDLYIIKDKISNFKKKLNKETNEFIDRAKEILKLIVK